MSQGESRASGTAARASGTASFRRGLGGSMGEVFERVIQHRLRISIDAIE